MRVLLIYTENPDTFWSFKYVLRIVCKKSTFPPLGLLTVAGMLPREFLQSGYPQLMNQLYEPASYHQRIWTFLEQHRPAEPRLRLSLADLTAYLKSFWWVGTWHEGRRAYWMLFWNTLRRRPRQFRHAIELAIIGHHFRRVVRSL